MAVDLSVLNTNQWMMQRRCESPPRASSTLMQHLGLSRLSSPLNSLRSLRSLASFAVLSLLHMIYQRTPVSLTAVLIITCIHVCQVWIPQISMLLEILHPLLQERAAPEMCVSSVRMGEACRCCVTAETAARGRQELWLAGAGWALSGCTHAPRILLHQNV